MWVATTNTPHNRNDFKLKYIEYSENLRKEQRRVSRQHLEELKLKERDHHIAERDIKRQKTSYENAIYRGMQSSHTHRLRSSIYDNCTEPSEYQSIFRSKPGEPGYVDESRVRFGTGAIDIPSTPSLVQGLRTPYHSIMSRRGSGQMAGRGSGPMAARSSHRYSSGITTGSCRPPILPDDLVKVRTMNTKFNILTQGQPNLIDRRETSKKLWTPKTERNNQIRKKLVEDLAYEKRQRSRYMPPGHYKITDIIVL